MGSQKRSHLSRTRSERGAKGCRLVLEDRVSSAFEFRLRLKRETPDGRTVRGSMVLQKTDPI